MDYAQVEDKFKTLKLQFLTGTLDEASFKAQLEQLMVQDESGRWWMIGYETGHWYVHDGAAWVRAEPPVQAPPRPVKEKKVEFSPSLVAAVEKAKFGGSEPVPPIPSSSEKIRLGPLPQVREVKKMGWGFWLGWLGGMAAGGLVFYYIVSDYHRANDLGNTWICTIPLITIGFIQWLVMRSYIKNAWLWLAANIVYGLIMGAVIDNTNNNYSTFARVLTIIVVFGYPLINIIAGPVWVARKRGSA